MTYGSVTEMARYQKKLPPPDLESARSWAGKWIRDAYINIVGVVHDVRETEDGIRLVARFQDEDQDRLIALEPLEGSIDYLLPGDGRARYRPMTDEEIAERRRALAAKKAAQQG